MTTLIAAVARNGVIGCKNTIPWHLPEDFKHFKETTKGQVVIMGTRTWDSLPKRPLPGRLNVVVSRKTYGDKGVACLGAEDTVMAGSIEDAEYLAALLYPDREVFVMGGASLYEQCMENANRLIISEVAQEPEGDTYFPPISPEVWREVSRVSREGFDIVEYHKLA